MLKEIATTYVNSECLRLYAEDTTPVTYFIGDRKTKTAFNISRNWKYVSGPKLSMTEAAKHKAIAGIVTGPTRSSAVADFIEWYAGTTFTGSYLARTYLNMPEPAKVSGSTGGSPDISSLEEKLDMMTKAIVDSNKRNTFEEALLEGIVAKGTDLSLEDLMSKAIRRVDDYITNTYGTLPTRVEVVTQTKTKVLEGVFHEKFELLLKVIGSANTPVMLTGPAGSGKNYTLEQVAEALGVGFYMTGAVTMEHKLTGFIDGHGVYHETEFYKAFVNGGLFMLDEIDASAPDALVTINSAIANGYFDFPTGRVKAHPDFRCVAAGNTFGVGADMVYVGRNQLDGASIDRFPIVKFGYSPAVERSLSNNDGELYSFIVRIRELVEKAGLRHIISMRATANCRKWKDAGIDIEDIVEANIVKSMSKDDLRSLMKHLPDTATNEWMTALRRVVERMV